MFGKLLLTYCTCKQVNYFDIFTKNGTCSNKISLLVFEYCLIPSKNLVYISCASCIHNGFQWVTENNKPHNRKQRASNHNKDIKRSNAQFLKDLPTKLYNCKRCATNHNWRHLNDQLSGYYKPSQYYFRVLFLLIFPSYDWFNTDQAKSEMENNFGLCLKCVGNAHFS